MSVIYTNDLETGLATMANQQPSCDMCEPIQSSFTALTNMLGKSKLMTTLFTIIPMIFMFIVLLYLEAFVFLLEMCCKRFHDFDFLLF